MQQKHYSQRIQRRRRWLSQRRLLVLVGCIVALATAYALMLPAISITQDAATQDGGFYQGQIAAQAEDASAVANAGEASDAGSGADNAAGAPRSESRSGDSHSGTAGATGAASTTGTAATTDAGSQGAAGGGPDEPAADANDTGAEGDSDDAASDGADDGSAEDADDQENVDPVAEAEAKAQADAIASAPAKDFKEQLKDDDDNVTLTVEVKAPRGAFPDGTTMKIEEVDPENVMFEVETAVKQAAGESAYVKQMRAVDITFLNDEGDEIEPARQVEVKITSDEIRAIEDPLLVHVVDRSKPAQADKPDDAEIVERVELVNADEDDKTVGNEDTLKFKTGEFSVYAIVEVPPAEEEEERQAQGVDELDGKGFYLSVTKNNSTKTFYFTNELADVNNSTVKIGKTSANAIGSAAVWVFEKVEGTQNNYYLYTVKDGDRHYMNMSSGGSMSMSTTDKTAFTVENYNGNTGKFYIYYQTGNNKMGLNMFSGENGKGFAGWSGKDDGSVIVLTYSPEEPGDDELGLDGQSYGLINYKDGLYGAAMMTNSQNNGARLKAQDVILRTNLPYEPDALFVAKGSDLPMWTFENLGSNKYYITTTVDGVTKYLSVTSSAVSLVDEPDDNCVLRVTAGSGEFEGKIRISNSGGYSPNLYSGRTSDGFGSYHDSGENEWFNLTELSELEDEEFIPYYASKVSVSDTERVYNGKQVVVYTRIWNDTKKKYEFFAIDHTGDLVQVFESGDTIEWVGLSVNTLLWDFTEYYEPGTTTPNYYYELQNTYTGEYLAPRIEGDQHLSDEVIGLNLNGRRYGDYYTTILAWDDPYYEYAGFKVKDGHLTACPLWEAEDFYFAIMEPPPEEHHVTTVKTVDNDDYGITMKMVDYNGTKHGNNNIYDRTQTDVIGDTGNTAGLVTPYLDENGYPTATKTDKSLSELYADATSVNHLFLASTYNESGYFEFNSTESFAHLNDDGTFTIYDELATIGKTGVSLDHGQFMPYNDIEGASYSERWTNETNELDEKLRDENPRKGEKLYEIPYDPNPNADLENNANYHFGMEMEASFTQTASGLDAWGHDIIFEFAGDDDMWFYVDDVLILDLGGIHKALTGTINFRTGQVTSSRGNSTLRAKFKESYIAKYKAENDDVAPSDEEVEAWLDTIFENGGTVFKDYTTHNMKMIYMERGAGASNLHMRFNLASVKQGTFILSKELSGAESETNNLIEFPYQIYYKTQDDGEARFHLLDPAHFDEFPVKYEGSTNNVTYLESYMPAGGTVAYEHVFMLKPGQAAEVRLPDGATTYYVVECGLNPDVYDTVNVNGSPAVQETTGNYVGSTARSDYKSTEDTLENRSSVKYDNHVADGAMRALTITKNLYDSDGQTRLHYAGNEDDPLVDKSTYSFRLYLGNENADPNDLPLAYMYSYHVKDPDGNYCRWNAELQEFTSLGSTSFEALSAEDKRLATFTTSIYGSISKIPADYVVEVRDLVIGTMFKVEERDYEIPKGYTLRLEDGYQRTDVDPDQNNKTTPISGTINPDEDPAILVSNQKGWGLTVEKVWTDKDFMAEHDPIYFAVYVKGVDAVSGEDTYTLVENTVHRMRTDESSIYYFFGNLQAGIPFENYTVFEVAVEPDPDYEPADDGSGDGVDGGEGGSGSGDVGEGGDGDDGGEGSGAASGYDDGLIVDDEGYVLNYGTVTPISGNDRLVIGGIPFGSDERHEGYQYKVSYAQGEQTDKNHNVRVDVVTNSRPGIKLLKTDWDGNPLAGATFAFKYGDGTDGDDVAAESYTTNEEGLITIAYVSPGDYTLIETAAPGEYTVLDSPMLITVGENDDHETTVDVSGVDQDFYTLEMNAQDMDAVITVKDRKSSLEVVKVDASTNEPLAGVHFALYRQTIDAYGNKIKDYTPIDGYRDLVTDDEGIVPLIDRSLAAGTYYLDETAALPGYDPIDDLCFTIGVDGKVSIESGGAPQWLTQTVDEDTKDIAYRITIPNGQQNKVSIMKVDVAATDRPLVGAVFDLYAVVDGERAETPLYANMTSGADGLLVCQGKTVFDLAKGTYHLVETEAPAGYNLRTTPVIITVSGSEVTYDDGTTFSQSNEGRSYDADSKVYTLKVTNTAGFELPSTGGPGTHLFTILGSILALGAGVLLWRRMIRIPQR